MNDLKNKYLYLNFWKPRWTKNSLALISHFTLTYTPGLRKCERHSRDEHTELSVLFDNLKGQCWKFGNSLACRCIWNYNYSSFKQVSEYTVPLNNHLNTVPLNNIWIQFLSTPNLNCWKKRDYKKCPNLWFRNFHELVPDPDPHKN